MVKTPFEHISTIELISEEMQLRLAQDGQPGKHGDFNPATLDLITTLQYCFYKELDPKPAENRFERLQSELRELEGIGNPELQPKCMAIIPIFVETVKALEESGALKA